MSRKLRTLAILLLIGLAIALYGEWIERNQPPLYLPIGFIENAEPVITPEESVSQPNRWDDPITPVVMLGDEFDIAVSNAKAEKRSVDILVVGGTLGGTAAMLSAAHDGITSLLVTDGDWNEDILTYAGFFLEEAPPTVYTSAIENNIQQYISRVRGIARTERGLPSDIAKFLRNEIEALPEGTLLSGYSISALARDASGQLHRALLRSNDGTNSIEVSFKIIIDGTKEGTLLSLAGIASRSGWDTSTGEPSSLPDQAIDAISMGYTMSGRTVNGIGRRLDGVQAQMGIIDRGYHGTYIHPQQVDECWEHSDVMSIFARQTVLRTKQTGCSAHFSFQSSFEDAVEVFFVNHGNERVIATIRMGSGTSFDVEKIGNPSDKFIRIGAFSVSNSNPLNIDIHSALPTDNLEGLIVRKLNTGRASTSLLTKRGRASIYFAGPWANTSNDIYVHAIGLETAPTIVIDGEFFSTKMVGPNTYIASNIALRNGERSIGIAENTVNDAMITVIPLSPASKMLPMQRSTAMKKNKQSWSVTFPRDGKIVASISRKNCIATCSFIIINEEGETMFSGSVDTLTGRPATNAVLAITDISAGQKYTLSIISSSKNISEPYVAYIDDSAGIYGNSTTTVVLNTPTEGRMYDLWVHSPRSETCIVSLGGTAINVEAQDGWTYAGTSISSSNGFSAKAGGFVEMYAVPNTSLDVYNLSLAPREELSIQQEDLPSGTYDISAYSETNPWTMSITNGTTNTVQQVAFVEAGQHFVSQQPLIWHHDDSILISSSEWPLHITIHQSVFETSKIAPYDTNTKPLFTVLASPLSVTNDELLLSASGSILFSPAPGGIAPVTIGLLEHPQTDSYVRLVLDAAFARLRYAEISEACLMKNDPTCDPRRYVRDPSIFNTNDSQSIHAVTVDGRRLIGVETLTESGAFAMRSSCQTRCYTSCIQGTIANNTCFEVERNQALVQNAILAIRGTNKTTSITSSKEDLVETLPSLMHAIRRDGLLKKKETYLEKMPYPKDFSLTLGMLIPQSEENVLVANTTISATHIASRALRTGSTELAIGEAVGHIAAFAISQERSSPGALVRSPEVITRLQKYLIDKGIMIFPTFDISNDHLLMKSIQLRLLQQKARTIVTWTNERLTNETDAMFETSIDELRSSIFGKDSIFTLEEALSRLSGIPKNDFGGLLNYGLKSGFITQKMLQFGPRELMGQQLDFDMLLKAEYLLHASTSDE